MYVHTHKHVCVYTYMFVLEIKSPHQFLQIQPTPQDSFLTSLIPYFYFPSSTIRIPDTNSINTFTHLLNNVIHLKLFQNCFRTITINKSAKKSSGFILNSLTPTFPFPYADPAQDCGAVVKYHFQVLRYVVTKVLAPFSSSPLSPSVPSASIFL